jgi:hypothetical protein
VPCRTVELQREYNRLWIARRREAFFRDKYCARCGSRKQLELDHIDPATKVTHNVWSWAQERRDVELAKCQVLCHDCHGFKSDDAMRIHPPDLMTAWCHVCRQFKDKIQFHRSNARWNGVCKVCIECARQRRKFLRVTQRTRVRCYERRNAGSIPAAKTTQG